jgi:hypothetical protein
MPADEHANPAVLKNTAIPPRIPKKKDDLHLASSDVARGQTGSHIGPKGI